ncbi:MAG: 16S rRNA (guanine(966)-N(2))-methyltransferase RsmD [Acidimicrobiia bacterium]|nr:16S rRNA (guanine(966)-N(2))-methyltransferase RsmD [Acidimicrobiia bacterium]MCY4433617.1 16S rRNA (guanine(966)-N(2))-methyltransferase RsmD [bacterium]
MTLRIISGEARGRRLSTPEGMEVRPTTSRVREAVFNSLHSQGWLEGADVLDLFAGSGALGLEAVSRGAASATFVESALSALATLKTNIESTGFDGRCRVVPGDVMKELLRLDREFDIALCDPPYQFDAWPELLSRVPADVVVVESDQAVDPGDGWDVIKQQRYAGTVVVIACRR